jgi:hypothetical protein
VKFISFRIRYSSITMWQKVSKWALSGVRGPVGDVFEVIGPEK